MGQNNANSHAVKTPSQEERIKIWCLSYARSSLIEARESAKLLLTNSAWREEIRMAVVCQMIFAYARPFTKSQVTASKRLRALDEAVIPKGFEGDHREALGMRDQAIGHKDALAFEKTALNRVIVIFDSNGTEIRTTAPHDMNEKGLRRMVERCEALIQHCEKGLERYVSFFDGFAQGAYFLNLEESPKAWLERQD